MIRRNPTSPNPFSEPAIVLLDEADLHLHPKWQRSIRQDLTSHFPATQFIVTAHSPIVAQASLDANLAVFERQGDHVVINNDAEKYTDWRIDQIAIEMFGLRSARPPQIQALFDERDQLLSNRSRTKRQETRLAEIEARIRELPVWDTPEDRDAMDIIRRAAALIKDKTPNQP
jgi:predicted ATP-binding protein involved in virulence